MKISELIEYLEKSKEENGDLEVFCVEGIRDWEELPVDKEETGIKTVKGKKCVIIRGQWG